MRNTLNDPQLELSLHDTILKEQQTQTPVQNMQWKAKQWGSN